MDIAVEFADTKEYAKDRITTAQQLWKKDAKRGSFMDALMYPTLKTFRYLKNKSTGISLSMFNETIKEFPHKIIWEIKQTSK